MTFYLFVLLAYLLGSIPFGLILTQSIYRFDIRAIGSGNIGATNVLRSGHKSLAFATLILDALKGVIAVFLYQYFNGHTFIEFNETHNFFQQDFLTPKLIVAIFVILGHIFPIFLKFKGGKGIATLGGCLFVLSWPIGLCAVCLWLGTFIISRKSALAALIATLGLPLFAYIFSGLTFMFWSLGILFLIIYTHQTNIFRLWQGKEFKIDLTSSKNSS